MTARAPSRLVRRVRLAASAREAVPRGARLLEDALHTASLPEAEGGHLLLVRRMDVGTIDTRRAPAALALQVEARFRSVAASAVHAADPAAEGAPAVWFRDAAEAHALLAVRVARGRTLGGWFWPLAVAAWRPSMDRREAMRALLASSAETAAGAFGVVALVDALRDAGALRPLLDALAPADGAGLLRALGLSPAAIRVDASRADGFADSDEIAGDADGHVLHPFPSAWLSALRFALAAWGPQDARTHWLAAVALAAEAPARMLDAGLGARASAAVRWVAQEMAPVSEQRVVDGARRFVEGGRHDHPAFGASELVDKVEFDAGSGSYPHPESPSASTAGSFDADGLDSPSSKHAAERHPHRLQPAAPADASSAGSADALSLEATNVGEATTRSTRSAQSQESQRSVESVESVESSVTAALPSDALPSASDAADASESLRLPQANSPDAPASSAAPDADAQQPVPQTPDTLRSARAVDAPTESNPREQGPAARRQEALTDGIARRTEAAGLPFLVNALSRLGMGDFLAEHPALIDADFPARLLTHIAARCDVAADDPAVLVLPPRTDADALEDAVFCAPEVWMRGIAAEGAARQRTRSSGGALMDASGRLPLAAWRATVPHRASGWMVDEGPDGAETRDGGALLLEAWTTALRRWTRRVARAGLRDVVRRPGRIAATRTHVDVVLDLADADPRIRRAGLDVDPGWVPWLGRVVQFHYRHGERAFRA